MTTLYRVIEWSTFVFRGKGVSLLMKDPTPNPTREYEWAVVTFEVGKKRRSRSYKGDYDKALAQYKAIVLKILDDTTVDL